jgi:hypothetical protein
MQTMHSMKLLITIGIIITLVMGFIVPNAMAIPKVYPDDGIWVDTFDDATDLKLTDTSLVNGAIELKKGLTEFQNYDFTGINNHYAYAYRTLFFIPFGKMFSPASHIPQEDVFDQKMNDSIKVKYSEYANWTGTWIKNFVVQHFRFKLHSSADVINKIDFSWYGRVTKNANINFYFWNSSSNLINGKWERLGLEFGGNNITFSRTISEGKIKYAIDENNYIDLCVVAYLNRIYFSDCILSTDYVSLKTTGEQGYKIGDGFVETKNPIVPTDLSPHFDGFYWEMLHWDDYQGDGTTIRYQLLYENSSNIYVPVQNEYFLNNPEGNNSFGFSQSPVYLNAVPYEKLKIRAKLNNTNSPLTTPRIFSWALTWQNSSQWQDSFETSYRVAVKNKVVIGNGAVSVSKIQGEWPMFGFNSENNRATPGPGPSVSSLYWYSEHVGGNFRNPVIGNGKVYIVSNTKTIYEYNMEFSSGGSSKNQPYTASHTFDYDIVNSPAVTEDYVIVATGKTGDGGLVNHIYALPRENISKSPIWDYTNNNIPICYFASPVIGGDKLFITSWGGDTGIYLDENNRYSNNKLLAIDLKNENKTWQAALSAPSYSTPAVSLSSDIVIAGCSSSDNNSIFAFNLDGTLLWSKNIGSVGYASPVIYKDMVFIPATSKRALSLKTNIYALNLTTGGMLWNKTVCDSILDYSNVGDSTPAVFNDVLYVASPNGTLFAIHASDGTQLWATPIYSRTVSSPQSLISSPVYADGYVYIGVPSPNKNDVQVIGISTTTHKLTWSVQTFFQDGVRSQVLGSPIVSNGLLFVADENSNMYSFGAYKTPSQEINGSIMSMLIKIPESYWWDRFYDFTSYNKTFSKISFKLIDENNNVLKDITNGSSLLLSTLTLPRSIRLRADFTTKNISANNPNLLRWALTFIEDTKPPFLDIKTITPSFTGWLNVVVPQISIRVKDNQTGLLINSARYTIQYILNNLTYTNSYAAFCTGANGTTLIQNLTANLSSIPDYLNITALKSITFSIKDLAGNTATKFIAIKQDITTPKSYILKQSIKPRYNETAKFIWINATSYDNGTDASGVKLVELYYRYSSTGIFSGTWVYFANSAQTSPHWNFNFTKHPNQPGGYFEVCTIATDNAGNVEEFPAQGDASFIYDWMKPDYPSYSGETLWFNELPRFSVSFSDDFRLDTVQYRPNIETVWTTIASHVNSSTYDTNDVGHSWSLKQQYWDIMKEDEVYYLYFRINDTLGNTLLVTNNNQAIIIRKDTSAPNVTINTPSLETEMSLVNNFTVSGLGNDHNGSGINKAFLYYRFSEDNSRWTNWTTYGDILNTPPYEWNFKATDGDGYYAVKINASDYAGNAIESKVLIINIVSFPTTLVLVLVGLVIVLLLITMILYIKWRIRK